MARDGNDAFLKKFAQKQLTFLCLNSILEVMTFLSQELFEQKGLGGSSHGSTITEGEDGTLYAAWYSGTKEKAADVKIFMTKKKPGENWQTPWLIEKEGITSKNPFITGDEDPSELAELENEETSEGNPVFYYDIPNRRLFLFWATMRGAGDKSGWSACILKAKHSDDGGKTWTAPRLVRDNIGWMTRNKPILMSNRELLLPIMAELGLAHSMFYRIKQSELNKGATDMQIQEPDVMIKGGVIQPTVVEVDPKNKPGTIYCWMRTNEHTTNCPFLVGFAKSENYGHTWSDIAPMIDRIENPDSATDAVGLQNGHVVLVCNPRKTGRQQLTVFLSEDGGNTFPYRRDLEPIDGREYHYPAVIQTKDGMIHVAYTYARLNIKWATFDEAWIKGQ
jgi:predicted neuraminidase